MNSEIIGWFGSLLVLISFIPKNVRLIRIINAVGCVVWVIYGFITHAPSVWVMNILVMLLNLYHLIGNKK